MAKLTPERFAEIQNRAKRLINMDVNGQLDGIKNQAVKEGKLTYTQDGNVDTSIMSQQNVAQNKMLSEINDYSNQQPISQSTIQNSKLPKEIIESMVNNPIDTTMLEMPGVTTSILDQMDYMTGGKILQQEQVQQPQPKKQKQVVQEQVVPNSTPIDYSMIKMIVEESIKKYASALKKSILQESKGTNNNNNELQAMKIGNKFSFITKNGDLYEAQLKFIKNINN